MPDHLSEAFVEAVPYVFTLLLGTFCTIIIKGHCFDRKQWQQEEEQSTAETPEAG